MNNQTPCNEFNASSYGQVNQIVSVALLKQTLPYPPRGYI